MRLFSKIGVFLLCLGMLALMVISQIVGSTIAALYLLQDMPVSVVESGGADGTLISYAMLFTLVVVSAVVFALVKWRIRQVSATVDAVAIPNITYDDTGKISNAVDNMNSARNAQQYTLQNPSHSSLSKNDLSRHYPSQYGVIDYLAIKPFTLRVAIALLGIWLLFLIGSEGLTYLLDKNPAVFMDALYTTAHSKWLLGMVIVLVVPIYEELVFRGILWSALSHQMKGQRGVWFASIVTSLIFAIIHTQYEVYELTTIFVLALILSYARYKSGSLLLPILIHILNNGVALWQYVMLLD